MVVRNNVSYEVRDKVAWIGLDRREKRNAIDDELLGGLVEAARQAQEEARAMVVFGHGPCFCAGLDLSEHRTREPAEVFHHSRAWHSAFSVIRRGAIPAIASLHGATIGGGLELAAACHIRVADATAFFALPEGSRGIYVGGGASVHVARLIGVSRMTDMMLTGRVIDAADAERVGLVQYLTPEGGASAHAAEVAARIVGMAPLSVLGVLQALPRIQDMSEDDGLFVESMMAALAQTGSDSAARLDDFVSKRTPKVAPTVRPDRSGIGAGNGSIGSRD